MGIAYSGGTIVYQNGLRADTTAHLLADIDAVLTACGMTHTAITGGWKYTMQSPQGLQAKLTIADLGDTEPFASTYHRLTLQFLTVDELGSGYAHKLAVGPGYAPIGYEIVANRCQVFIALRGYATQSVPKPIGEPDTPPARYAFAGGVPYVASPGGECAAAGGDQSTTEIWWSCSKEEASGEVDHFRSGRYCSKYFSYGLNGAITVNSGSTTDTPYTGTLQLYPLTMTEDADFWFFSFPKIVKYSSGDPMALDAFLGWGFAIRGQLWDALLCSRDTAVDQVLVTSQTDAANGIQRGKWLAWNYRVPGDTKGGGGTWFGTLYLLMGKPFTAGTWNYAY